MGKEPSIQRQSILSTLLIFLGFAIGALNLLILQPKILTIDEWGLTRVIAESAVLFASFSTLGITSVVSKFLPIYERFLPSNKIELPTLTIGVFCIGIALTQILLMVFKPAIVGAFGRNNNSFSQYYFAIQLVVFFQGIFLFLEPYAWFTGKVVLANGMREVAFRCVTTILLVLVAIKFINYHSFILLFSLSFLPPVFIVAMAIFRSNKIIISFTFSKVTRRLKNKMTSLAFYVFLTNISTIAFIVCDTLFLASLYNFGQAGIYAVVQYFASVIEIPMRSLITSSIPKISYYWAERNMDGLQSIYEKSAQNLLIIGVGIAGFLLINIHNIITYLPTPYTLIALPMCILFFGKLINLGTGVNAQILQLSKFWKFDFLSTLIYPIIGIPLNFYLIRNWGMQGAAVANVIAIFVYNFLRFIFLYSNYKLQPFKIINLWTLNLGLALTLLFYIIPPFANLYVDGIVRSALFLGIYGYLILQFKLSKEFVDLFANWKMKLKWFR